MNNALQISKKFINKLKETGYPVSQAYLFGSYAKGDYNRWSDIDICVISRKHGQDFVKDFVNLKGVASNIDVRIEPVALSPDQFNNKYSTLASEIKRYGISLTK